MTSTLLQAPHSPQTNAVATHSRSTMAWSNEKLRFSCIDNIGLKQLWKLIALDSTNTTATAAGAGAGAGIGAIPNATTTASTPTAFMQTNANNAGAAKMKSSNNTNNNNNTISHTDNLQNPNINNTNNHNEAHHFENCENVSEYLTVQREILPPNHMSLLKFLAINALELSAPASPALLQQNQTPPASVCRKPQGWVQLSGHPESIVPTSTGIVRKRVASLTDNEVQAYQQLSAEPLTAKIVPQFYGTLHLDSGDYFIELQDLLSGFKDPCVMDIKMGCRTFLESEVSNTTLRPDLYKKMVAIDANAPTAAEHQQQAITKLRYMLFRESMSSSQAKGFRIEALRLRGRAPIKDLKTVRTSEQIAQTIEQFLGHKRTIHKELIKRLKHMRTVIEKSAFFQRHEIVGSSIFIVYDDDRVGVWLIDFAKSRSLPETLAITHRADWVPGNREEGLLKGVDDLIGAFEGVYARSSGRRCLQI